MEHDELTPASVVAESLVDEIQHEAGELIDTPVLSKDLAPCRPGDTCLARLPMKGSRHIIMSGEVLEVIGGHELALALIVQPYVPGWTPIFCGINDVVSLGVYE